MYRINPLMRNVLITTDEVIFHAQTKHTLDPRMVEQNIIIAEERFLRPALGFDFYEALIESKNLEITDVNKAAQQVLFDASLPAGAEAYTLKTGDILNALEYLSADNKALWKQVLWKLAAEAVMLLALPEGFIQFGSAGAVHNQPASSPMSNNGIVTPNLGSVKWAMDKKLMDRIDPLQQALHVWLCKKQKADSEKYPLYEKECACDEDGVAYKRKSDVVLGLYDDIDNETSNGCC